jgi:hypothetical protein
MSCSGPIDASKVRFGLDWLGIAIETRRPERTGAAASRTFSGGM